MNISKTAPDIKVAESIINGENSDAYDYDAAGYHIQQAIEKSLKYYLSNVYGENENENRFRTHNIGTLLARCYEHGMTSDDFPEGLSSLADEITLWESGSRYGEETVSDVDDLKTALSYAKELYENVKMRVNEKR